jgi:hypothetical protein
MSYHTRNVEHTKIMQSQNAHSAIYVRLVRGGCLSVHKFSIIMPTCSFDTHVGCMATLVVTSTAILVPWLAATSIAGYNMLPIKTTQAIQCNTTQHTEIHSTMVLPCSTL